MALASALTGFNWSVKNTFVHCDVTPKEAESTVAHKWNLRSDITACRDRETLEFLNSLASGDYADKTEADTNSTAPSENDTEEIAPPPGLEQLQGRQEPKDAQVAMQRTSMSLGAAAHDKGECKPCAWNWRPDGCSKGKNCEFCHLCEEGLFKQRRREKIARLRAEEKAAKRALKAAALPESQKDDSNA